MKRCYCGRHELGDAGTYTDNEGIHTAHRCGGTLDMSDAYHRMRIICDAVSTLDGHAVRVLYLRDPVVHALVEYGRRLEANRPDGVVGVHLAVEDVRTALRSIPLPGPQYAPGTEPTAADACRQLVELVEYALRQLQVVVGG